MKTEKENKQEREREREREEEMVKENISYRLVFLTSRQATNEH